MNLKRTGNCRVEGCGRIEFARNWCHRHYDSNRRYGDPLTVDSQVHRDAINAERARVQTGKPSWWQGKTRPRASAETKAKMSAAHTGRPKSVEHRENIRKARTGVTRPGVGRAISAALNSRTESAKALHRARASAATAANPPKHGRGIKTEYSGIIFRSTWEARFAKALDARGIGWAYEPKVVDLGPCSYVPDFDIPTFGCFAEVKGYLDERSERKLALYKARFPEKPIWLVMEKELSVCESSVENSSLYKPLSY